MSLLSITKQTAKQTVEQNIKPANTAVRWPLAKLKQVAIDKLEEVLNKRELSPADINATVASLAKLDKLNIEEEKLYSPKTISTMEVAKMTDEDIERKIHELEQKILEINNVSNESPIRASITS